MREIKFRAWDNWTSKFVDNDNPYHDDLLIDLDGTLRELCSDEGGMDICRADEGRFILMQYTGLKDKNGKEIYEGDVLSYDEPDYASLTVVVEWGDGGFIIKWLHNNAESPIFSYPTNLLEVIGNIYENKGLLK